MTDHRAYYSLVQFCPDRGKAESANIGVLLLCPELRFADVKLAKSNARVAQFFGRDSFEEARLRLSKNALEARIRDKTDWSEGFAALERFIGTRANDIVLTAARPMKTADPAADLVKLFAELVETRVSTKAEMQPEVFRRLRSQLSEPRFKGRIEFDRKYEVPVMGLRVKAEYAFQNGSLNLVRTRQFSGSPANVMRHASELAVEGNLIQKHSERANPVVLIVVPAFAGEAAELGDRVSNVFQEFDVQTIAENMIDVFVERIAFSAH